LPLATFPLSGFEFIVGGRPPAPPGCGLRPRGLVVLSCVWHRSAARA